ncbi:MAG: M23 family metallopeptidase [Bdellovibrionales bacterium]|jgi:murein DD-endopeptidase MepM/ murein hydrolase activator NlpD
MMKPATLIAVLFLSTTLAGCTASRPPSYNLPDSNSLVAGDTYTVGRNENIYAIAQKEGLNMRDIIALNELKPPFALHMGQTLTLSSRDKYAAPRPMAAPLDYIDKGPMAPSSTGLAGTIGVTAIPLESISEPPPATKALPPITNYNQTPQPIAQETSLAPENESSPAPIAAAPAPAPSAALTGKTPSFGWPVRGTVISAFGSKGKGLDNDGINIAAPKGSPVKAAEGGIVAYAGNEMKGFGNLVLIRHEGGWVTAYAHLERLVVARDAVVAKGDMIGTVGTSGGVSSPQLHFEARQEGKPVDPELVIK